MSKLLVNDLSVAYGERTALCGFDHTAKEGEITALIGPNGAGKTTAIRAISGTIPVRSGAVQVDGKDMRTLSHIVRARLISVVPQARQLGGAFTVWQTVMMGRTPYMSWVGKESAGDRRIVKQALAQTELEDFSERQIAELSGGEQQRVLLARALAQETGVLLLDEPTNHLDLKHQTRLLDLVRKLSLEKQLTVLMAMHDLNLAARIADKIILLVDGKIIRTGIPAKVMKADLLSEAYGVRVEIMDDPDTGRPVILTRGEFI